MKNSRVCAGNAVGMQIDNMGRPIASTVGVLTQYQGNYTLDSFIGTIDKNRRALGGAHVPPTKVFRWLTASVNETIVKTTRRCSGGP